MLAKGLYISTTIETHKNWENLYSSPFVYFGKKKEQSFNPKSLNSVLMFTSLDNIDFIYNWKITQNTSRKP